MAQRKLRTVRLPRRRGATHALPRGKQRRCLSFSGSPLSTGRRGSLSCAVPPPTHTVSRSHRRLAPSLLRRRRDGSATVDGALDGRARPGLRQVGVAPWCASGRQIWPHVAAGRASASAAALRALATYGAPPCHGGGRRRFDASALRAGPRSDGPAVPAAMPDVAGLTGVVDAQLKGHLKRRLVRSEGATNDYVFVSPPTAVEHEADARAATPAERSADIAAAAAARGKARRSPAVGSQVDAVPAEEVSVVADVAPDAVAEEIAVAPGPARLRFAVVVLAALAAAGAWLSWPATGGTAAPPERGRIATASSGGEALEGRPPAAVRAEDRPSLAGAPGGARAEGAQGAAERLEAAPSGDAERREASAPAVRGAEGERSAAEASDGAERLAEERPEAPDAGPGARSAAVLADAALDLRHASMGAEAAPGDVGGDLGAILSWFPTIQDAYSLGHLRVQRERLGDDTAEATCRLVIGNDGDDMWPASTKLQLVSGIDWGLVELHVGEVRPGLHVELSLELRVAFSDEAGQSDHHSSAWVLEADRQPFGPLLLLDVTWI